MADIIVDGKTRVAFVATIADPTGPTVAELGAGVELSDVLTADGLVGFEADTADVDNSSIASTFDTVLPGRASYSGTMLRLKKQSGIDTVFDTLVREAAGSIVVRRDVPANQAWAAGDDVEVYHGRAGETRMLAPEKNTVRRYEVPWKIDQEPELRAVVAA